MPQVIYDLKGYPRFVYTARDFAERKQPKPEQLANLLIRSIFEDGGLGRVISIDEVTSGPSNNGWTIRFTGETNGRTADPYIAIYDGQAISYNDDPSRQSRDLSEGLALALDFAAKKGQKNCTKGKPCGGSCVQKGDNCRIDNLSQNQKKAANLLSRLINAFKSIKNAITGSSAPKTQSKSDPGDTRSSPVQTGSRSYLTYADAYRDQNKAVSQVLEKEKALASIRASKNEFFTVDGKQYTKREALKFADESLKQAQKQSMDSVLSRLERLAQQKRQDPDSFGYAEDVGSRDPGHDWLRPQLSSIDPGVRLDAKKKIVRIRDGDGAYVDIKVANGREFRELYNKYQPIIQEVNSGASEVRNRSDRAQITNLAKVQKTTPEVAEARIDAIRKFTGDDYSGMRAADSGGDTYWNVERRKTLPVPDQAKEDAKLVNDYIENSPKYEGAIYRGFRQDTPDGAEYIRSIRDKLKSQEGYSLTSFSSFSSNMTIAEKFASTSKTEDPGDLFVMEVKRNTTGASIRSVSDVPAEDEILVPKNTRYRYIGEREVVNGSVKTIVYEVEEF